MSLNHFNHSNHIKMSNIDISDIEKVLESYLKTVHPLDANGFIIRIADVQKNNYERRRIYIVNFPYIKNTFLNIDDIISTWSDYALSNIIENYDLNQLFTIISIDPIRINKDFDEVIIQYSGSSLNPENLIRSLCLDIINKMNQRLIELYMDETYPNIDIADSKQYDEYNRLFDNIDIDDIYHKYKMADIYIPIKLTSDDNQFEPTTFYINGTLDTKNQLIDIIDDIRSCLQTDDIDEKLEYSADEIIYKFGTNIKTKEFAIITDPNI